ncbi:hypothetical protein APHAL10511_006398 [Amanita phalloides]|nr:hypothetical protein APHAL10511_006398 [Amanita phalloides]
MATYEAGEEDDEEDDEDGVGAGGPWLEDSIACLTAALAPPIYSLSSMRLHGSDMIKNKEPEYFPQPTPADDPPPPFTIEDIPPEFAPYVAEFSILNDGTVVSHDPHLNNDGEALYRFLLSQSLQAPHYRLHCRGTHSETHHRHVTRQTSNGQTETSTESYTETMTDFDFLINIHPSLPTSTILQNNSCGPIHWSVPDSEPAYRGRMVQEIEQPFTGTKHTAKRTGKEYSAWRSERISRGLPPWISKDSWLSQQHGDMDDGTVLKSSKTLRQWADEYCASPKYLKEFKYEKVLYGWNLGHLEHAIRTTISSTPYHGSIEVYFKIENSKVYVRPNNRLSRMLSNIWLKILSIILLIFPFIWLFKRFHSRGGGRWEVCGGAYALKRVVKGEDDNLASSSEPTTKVVGVREGEWFRRWEGVIRRSVAGRYQSSIPIPISDDETDRRFFLGYLDGY